MGAALELLADGFGLEKLGLTREAVCARSHDHTGTFDYHFGPRSGRSLRADLAKRYRELALAEVTANAELYELVLDALAGAAPGMTMREIAAPSLRRDLADFDASQLGTEGRARERLYYLMLALSDLDPDTTGVDYEKCLAQSYDDELAAYRIAYERFCEVTGREFVEEVGRTERAVHYYLEGVIVATRFGRAPHEDEVVDTVLRLLLVTTKPTHGDDIDVDAELLGSTRR